jgi:hypothetical protein
MSWRHKVKFFSKASDGSFAECIFKNMDYALYGWLSLLEDEKFTYEIISEEEFKSQKLTRIDAYNLVMKGGRSVCGNIFEYKIEK